MKRVYYPKYEEAQKIVQQKGLNSSKEYEKVYKELGLPSSPRKTYNDSWIGWADFLGKEEYPSFINAQKMVQEKGINSGQEYKSICKELGLPSHPDEYYRGRWTGWADFLGKVENKLSYEEVQRIVQEKGIRTKMEYISLYKDLGLPSDPSNTYKDNWTCWADFLGKEQVSFPSYAEAQRIVQERGIKSQIEYSASYKGLGLPSCPQYTYKGKGWIDWYDFLGKPKGISSEERKTSILTRLSINPALLKEDAPLQILYLVASQLDKQVAKMIEELLGANSFEERLKMVKDQLKEIKEETTPVYKITPIDELSEMKSILEEFDDLSDTLSDEVKSDLNTIFENYMHNVVNRGLISEYDG